MTKSYKTGFDTAYKACLAALRRLEFSIEYKNKEKGLINASTPTSLFSWGEDIDVRIIQDQGKIVVECVSNARSQLFTWGKNEANMNNFFKELNTILSQ
jgi:Protein of unknown function (DUF1499)